MTAVAMRMDIETSRARLRWTMAVSAVLHLLLMLWITLYRGERHQLMGLTEITLLEPGDLEPAGAAGPAPAAVAPVPWAGLARAHAVDVRFRRERSEADVAPEPQSELALNDRLDARLSDLRTSAHTAAPGAALPTTPAAIWGTPAAVASGPGGAGSAPLALSRGGSGGPSLDLTRGGGPAGSPALAAATLRGASAAAAAPATGGDATARRTLAGATLAGPIADRAVLSHVTPLYPEWAKREGVEGSVTLYFVVRPDGAVKENVLVQKTAGFEDFDESARAALRAWRFAPLRGGRTGEQWGTITFHFRLRDAG
jgi:TonB family protein